jgi:hypothetical protein
MYRDRIFWRLLDRTGWHPSKDDDVTITDFDRSQPDLAIVRGEPEDYRDRHATAADIGLAIEISDSTPSDQRPIDQDAALRLRQDPGLLDR